MQTHLCPQCSLVIPDKDINEANDVAYCRHCKGSFSCAELKRSKHMPASGADAVPPLGAWYRDDNHQKVIGATCKSVLKAINTGMVAVPWAVAVLVLMGITLIGTLESLGIRTPEWIPIQAREIATKSGGCMVVIMWIFALIFAWLGVRKLGVFFLHCAGKVEVVISEGVGSVTTSAFGIGQRRPFTPSKVEGVWIEQERFARKRRVFYKPIIVLKPLDAAPIRFGLQLREDRLEYLVAAVNQALGQAKK